MQRLTGDSKMTSATEAISVWVRQESQSQDAAGVNAMMDLVAAEVADQGIAVERIAGREGLGDHLVLRAGPQNGQAPVLVLSHLDTVHPKGTLNGPLPLRIEGDRFYGPGLYDMKAGAWMALQAFREALAEGLLSRPVTFIFTADEEIGSPTSRALIEAEAKGARAALITEPARHGGKIVTARKGTASFEMEIEGRAAHAGVNHALGRSALREAAHQVLTLEGMTDYEAGTTINVGQLKGGTVTNVVPQFASLKIDGRVSSLAAGEDLVRRVLALTPRTPDTVLKIRGGMNRPPYEKTPEVAALFEHAKALAAGIGFTLEDVPMTGGGSDGNFTAALGVPTLDGLGIDGDGAHTLQEHGLISSIAPRQALMKALLRTL